MIPTVLIVGFVLGIVAGMPTTSRRRRPLLAAAGVIAALAWGIGVAISDSDAGTLVTGTLLALGNIVVAALLGMMAWWLIP